MATKKTPTQGDYDARQAAALGLGTGVVTTAATAASKLNNTSVPKLVSKYVENPNGTGNSVLTHTINYVAPHVDPLSKVLGESIGNGVALGGTAAAVYYAAKGIKHLVNNYQFRNH